MKKLLVKHLSASEIPNSKAGIMKPQIVVEMEHINVPVAIKSSARLRASLYPSLEVTGWNIWAPII